MSAAATLTIARASNPTRKSRKSSEATVNAKLNSTHKWSHAGVYVCVITSAGLNGYANSMHATIPAAGWMLGIMIPALVLILSKVAGMQHKRRVCIRVNKRNFMLAYFTGGVGAFLLALSIYHCACSIALLTGSTLWLGVPMAIAIDGGLVACELDIVLA